MKQRRFVLFFCCVVTLLFVGCGAKKTAEHPLFVALESKRTGIDFSNNLTYSPQFNLFKYMYFYNGSGIGAGDFNNDGTIDLFFASNQGQNKLYLNEGGLKFKDVTAEATIPNDGGWSTGVSVVDINNDGLLDIYVCRVGQYETLHSKNQFLINQGVDKNGVPQFNDEAHAMGLDFSGFSTQAAFFDYDNDGDLDMFLLNHSVHQNNNFRPRAVFAGTYDSLSGDRIYRNEARPPQTPPVQGLANAQSSPVNRSASNAESLKTGLGAAGSSSTGGGREEAIRFTDVTKQAGINSTAISYGLGICVADVNLDGYPDIYIGNDFHENDYLYINQKNGTFKDEGEECFMHTSQYSMGVDVADINNDARPEIISMDMLPADPYILKRSLGEDSYDLFHEKIGMGYSYQFTRNNLQYNRGNGCFSEVGLYSGVAATDWSWAPLWMDFDNDGYKDLFISNGIPKRMNDIDYLNFVSSGEVQQKITADDMQGKDLSLIKKFPEIKLPNKFFKNNGNLSFTDEKDLVEGDAPTFSNGAVYADLDGDGDLDIVVNNIDEPALVYENKTGDSRLHDFLDLTLRGPEQNTNALGAKVVLFSGNEVRTYENYPVKGFLSGMQTPLHIGLKNTEIDSAFLIWPDRTYQRLTLADRRASKTIKYHKGLSLFDFSVLTSHQANKTFRAEDISVQTGLNYLHQENRFVEFDREPLIPHEVSTEGPAIAVADINKDGLDDVFVGGARDRKSAVFLQGADGRFNKTTQPVLDADSVYENTGACWADVNNDGTVDLIAASGGNEFYGPDAHNSPRVYLNDGKGNLSKLSNAFHNISVTASCVVPYDFNNDGYADLFIGGRAVPYAYGQTPQSYLLLNNKNGTFSDVTARYANDLVHPGMVTNAIWFDVDKDGDKDLLLSLEWGGIIAFVNNGGRFEKKVLSDKKGWWNFLLPVDVNGDGKVDLIAGNLGLNSRLKASEKEPVRLYYNDFDGNGKKEQVLTYYVDGKEIPFAAKAELEKQMPVLKKKFLYAEDLAEASLNEIFGDDKLGSAEVLTADYFANAVLLNKGDGTFETRALPAEAQFTSFRDAVVADANGDGKPDVLLAGNYYDSNIEMGRYDADFGTLLLNDGGGKFHCGSLNGLAVKGQVRHVQPIRLGKGAAFVLARNNDSLKVIHFKPHPSPAPIPTFPR